jgi:hypothetical protein
MNHAIREGLGCGSSVYFKRCGCVCQSNLFHTTPSREGLKKVYRSQHAQAHIQYPDLDNLVKFVLDALVGIAYSDDRQLFRISARKVYDREGECKGRIGIDITPNVIDLT